MGTNETVKGLIRRLDETDAEENLFNQAFELIDSFCCRIETDSCIIDLMSQLILKMASVKKGTLSMILEVWKRYLPFLKMYYFAMEPSVCDGFVGLLEEAILSSIESLKCHLEETKDRPSDIDAKACGVTNFLCQRLSASISFFVHVNKNFANFTILILTCSKVNLMSANCCFLSIPFSSFW